MTFSLITLSHNKLEYTRRCLSALVTHSEVEAAWEVIVVDNGSTDGSAEWCHDELTRLGALHGVPTKVIRNPANIGCSRARNQGVALARGEYLVFVDNDVMPRTTNWMPELRRALEKEPAVGMAGAKLLYPWEPYPIQCAGVGISRRGHVSFLGRGEDRTMAEHNQRRVVQCLISACLLVPARLLREYGGFDEVFHPVQFEDFDLVYRLREAGYQALYVPEVEMYHFESVTTQGTPQLSNASVVIRNGLRFQKRWRHIFAQEDGPLETECRWKRIESRPLHAIADELPLC